MSFTVDDFHDLIRLVETRPEWRAELRRLVLTNELLTVPDQLAALRARSEEQFQALAEAQQRTDLQLATLTERVTALTVAQERTDSQLTALTERVTALAAAQERMDNHLTALTERVTTLTERVTALAAAQERMDNHLTALTERVTTLTERVTALAAAQERMDRQLTALTEQVTALTERVTTLTAAQERMDRQLATLTEQVAALTRVVHTLTVDVGTLKGKSLEADYRSRGHAYLSRVIRRPHVLTADELMTIIEDARDRKMLSDIEAQDLYETDLVVRGRRLEDGTEVYLVVEVSWGVGPHDVERALQRARMLSHIGLATIPVVAGEHILPEAHERARQSQVWQVTDGRAIPPVSASSPN